MHRRHRWTALIALVAVVAACEASLGPGDLELRTEVAPTLVAAGDTVTLRAIMHNTGSESIQPGAGCGPPALFELRHGVTEVVHPIPLDGAFTCPFLDFHQLDPGETDTVRFRWRVEVHSGTWSVRSGFRSGVRLVRLTPPVSLTVRQATAGPGQIR